MIAILVALVIIVSLSYFFTYLSMRNFKHSPSKKLKYAPFLIRNLPRFNQEILARIYRESVTEELVFSIEKLRKANSEALVLYIPEFLKNKLVELELLELEDYISSTPNFTKATQSHSYSWNLKTELKNEIPRLKKNFFSQLNLEPDQQFYLQIVCLPTRGQPFSFKTNIRACVVEKDPHFKVGLVKKLDELIKQSTNLIREKRQDGTSEVVFKEFKKRQLSSKKDKRHALNTAQLLEFVNYA